MNALKMWSGPENVPGLVAYLEWTLEGKPFPQSEGDAIAILAKLKDPAAAPVLAKFLPNGFHRGGAANALKAIGPPAEKAVFPMLEHKDGWTVREACFVLKEIGTKESIEPLKKLIDKKPDFLVAPPANEALQAVSKRN
jgi:HEAT repeat protein